MQVGACLTLRRHPVHRAHGLAVDKNDAFVPSAHLRQVELHHDGLPVEIGEQLQKRVQVLVALADMEDTGAAVAVKRLDDNVLVAGAKSVDLTAVQGDERWWHQAFELCYEKLFRCISHMRRIVHHERVGVYALK